MHAMRIAWAVEGACIGIGLMLALVMGFEAGGVWPGLIAGAPFIAASVVESARIPLVRAFFMVRGVRWKLVALIAVLLASGLTIENLVFGCERALTLRIAQVRLLTQRPRAGTHSHSGYFRNRDATSNQKPHHATTNAA
jgi:hypothetical protein